MAESEEIQRHLREKTGSFILKAPTNLKSEIWQKFHMVFQKKENDDSEIPVNYYCACIKCNKMGRGLGRVGLKSCIFRRVGLGWVELSDGLGWVSKNGPMSTSDQK
ncbi:hypothetical protein HELRODRAFT_183968 [Helobdella robusta]|uniref:Uncharacterized protein n=1 Tax=Helobdella robusta TaxID=6412 RepID=T1FKD5_HELRO|nr:hypothetical protein HELRODRAFT_183968 [Helobdella robusta]ESO09701.1 hypothetical protein HELRODRAFT_183968 [Helobdella robusta]